MEKIIYIFILIFSSHSFAFYLNTNIGAAFEDNEIEVYVTSNSTCTNAGITKEELLTLAVSGAKKYWNKVSTSNIKIKKGGIYNTTDSKYLTEKLCAEDSNTSCPTATSVPTGAKNIIIACNNNTTDNFPSSEYLALTAPVKLSGSYIRGSVILINDSVNTQFDNLSNEEIKNVMAHEIGHAFGLGHTDKKEALMYHEENKDRKRLAQDDIDGVSYLYPNQFDGCKGLLGLSIGANHDSNNGGPFLKNLLIGLSIGLLSVFFLIKITQSLVYIRRFKQI